MAGDWIKMRIDLQSHPKVVRILSATGADKFRVIGGLHAVWGVFDQHSEDGILHGYTPELMDHVIGWEGFSSAMIAVGWLDFSNGADLKMPEFSEHNGKSAKRRAEDQKRKRESRKSPQSVRKPSANSHGEKRTREEKILKEGANAPTFWDIGVGMGIPRPVIGKQIKSAGEDKVAEVLAHMAVKKPADPTQYFMAATTPKARGFVC